MHSLLATVHLLGQLFSNCFRNACAQGFLTFGKCRLARWANIASSEIDTIFGRQQSKIALQRYGMAVFVYTETRCGWSRGEHEALD
jgi:hypothetical protein